MPLKFIRSVLVITCLWLPVSASAALTDFDGVWETLLRCGPLKRPGGANPNEFSMKIIIGVTNGSGYQERERQLQAGIERRKEKLEFSKGEVNFNIDTASGVTNTAQLKMSGKTNPMTSFKIAGSMYSNGNALRDCTAIGTLIMPSAASLAGKRDAAAAAISSSPTATATVTPKPVPPATALPSGPADKAAKDAEMKALIDKKVAEKERALKAASEKELAAKEAEIKAAAQNELAIREAAIKAQAEKDLAEKTAAMKAALENKMTEKETPSKSAAMRAATEN